jgi:hypothetical protein
VLDERVGEGSYTVYYIQNVQYNIMFVHNYLEYCGSKHNKRYDSTGLLSDK